MHKSCSCGLEILCRWWFTQSEVVNVMMMMLCFQGDSPVNLSSRLVCCFLGESSLTSQSGVLTVAVIYFHHKHLVSLSFCYWQTLFFGKKYDKELVGQTRGQTVGRTLLHIQLWYFFPHISCQRLPYHATFVWGTNRHNPNLRSWLIC